MGNVQTSSIANQLLPFDTYIAEVPQLKYVESLGSTRFMKVARAEQDDIPFVVKVFVLPEQFNHVELYRDQVLKINRRLQGYPNCVAFSRVYLTARSAILCRPFYKSTLYDRLSTRPFLCPIEKHWIAFQLLKALGQLRIALVRHGDIKSQNVLVSSSLWIQLTDFASFKPAFLPYDNPSDFTFFFDTSRRRFCYLAPERFKELVDLQNKNTGTGFINFYEGITDAMDIFSMGCLLVELLTDGRLIAFNLPQAIDYKHMNEDQSQLYVKRLNDQIVEPEFRKLITIMLDRNPRKRKDEYWKFSPCSSPDLFPPIFEKYLYNYFKELQEQPTSDALITKLYVERDNFIAALRDPDAAPVSVLFINVVCAALRSCQSLTSKMDAISLLQQLAKISPPAIVFERIVPYLANSLSDPFVFVRAESIIILKEIIFNAANDGIPPEECRLLEHFVFPKMKPILADSSTLVKIAFASNLGHFSHIALKFFEVNVNRLRSESPEQQLTSPSASPSNEVAVCESPNNALKTSSRLERFLSNEKKHLLQNEHQALQDTINEFFVSLCGSENEVRRCLFEWNNLDLLCQFFGTTRVTDVLMHMISLLNDKNDWRIRAAFFEACPVLAKHMGENQTSKLKPFLQQGLQDNEEFVVLESLRCIHTLCTRQLLHKAVICDILPDVVPFLVHPNKWLRVAVVNILTGLESTFSIADIYCKLTPLVKPFLKEQLIRLNNRDVIYETLVKPIERQIWDLLAKESSNSDELIAAIEDRRTLEKLGGGRNSLFSINLKPPTTADIQSNPHRDSVDSRHHIDVLLRKLQNMGMDNQLEEKLIAFKHILSRMDKFSNKKAINDKYMDFARINLRDLKRVRRKIFDLETGTHRRGKELTASHFFVDQFGTQHTIFNASELIEPAQVVDLSADHHLTQRIIVDDSSAHILLEETLRHKQQRYADQKRITTCAGVSNSEIAERIAAAAFDSGDGVGVNNGISHGDGNSLLTNGRIGSIDRNYGSESKRWKHARRPNIRMLAHLHEHGGKITRLAKNPDQEYFASSCMDKSVKIWSAASLQNQSQPASMSLDTFRYSHPINACGFMGDRGGHLVMACADASLQTFDIERKHLLKSIQLDRETEGPVNDLYCVEHLIYVLTHHSSVFCYDLRVAPKKSRNAFELSSVWERQVKNSYGLITSFCVDIVNQHWMLLTASSATTKNMLLWDLRFAGLEVATWSHPSDKIIPLRCWSIPNGSSSHQALTNCSREGELSLWDLSSQSRTDVFWSSTETPLTYKNEIVSSAVAPSVTDGDNVIFSGDSEGSLRCWNLRNADASYYLCGPYRRYLPMLDNVRDLQQHMKPTGKIVYRQMKCRDSVLRVQVEDRSQLTSQTINNGGSEHQTIGGVSSGQQQLQVSESHWGGITDLLSLWPDLLISSGREGVIKLWKVG